MTTLAAQPSSGVTPEPEAKHVGVGDTVSALKGTEFGWPKKKPLIQSRGATQKIRV